MESKDMIKHKVCFFDRIKKFFLKLLKKSNTSSKIYEKNLEQGLKNQKNIFENSIVIEQDEEELRLLKLQQAYKNGEILEEDIPESEKNKLINLYKEQNRKLEETIEKEKYELRKILDSLKV